MRVCLRLFSCCVLATSVATAAAGQLFRVRSSQVSLLAQHVNDQYSPDQVDILSHQRRLTDEDDVLLQTTPSIMSAIQSSLSLESVRPESYLKVVAEERRELEQCHDQAQVDEVVLGRFATSDFFKCFWPARVILRFLDQVVSQQAGSVSKFQISTTLEGREIPAYRVSSGSGPDGGSKPIIFIQGMLHAREWISPPTVIYTLAALLDGLHNQDPMVMAVVNVFDFVFVPIVNIDGYLYTWSADRYWRKNRRGGFGVDLNRNYGPVSMFGGPGSSGSTGSQVYHGEKAFSEPEIRGINHWMQTVSIRGSVDVHSYAASVYVPREATELRDLAKGMAKKINSVHSDQKYGTKYTTTGGTFKENQYFAFDKRPSFTLELRGYDFRIDPSYIVKSGQENFRGFLYFASSLKK